MREDAAWSPILREQGALEELAESALRSYGTQGMSCFIPN